MFCEKCGKEISEGAGFCGSCGAPVGEKSTASVSQENAAAPSPVIAAAPRIPNPVVVKIASYLKGFFSSKVTQTVGIAAKSTGIEWLIFAAANIILFAISATLNVKYIFMQNVIFSYISDEMISMGLVFLANFLIAAISYFALAGALFGAAYIIFKKSVSFTCVLNMLGYSCMPIVIAVTANIVLGLIYIPLAALLYIVAVIMTFCLLYVGIQKLDTISKTPYFVFSGAVAVTVIIVMLSVYLLYGMVVKNAVSNGISGLSDSLSGLGSLSLY